MQTQEGAIKQRKTIIEKYGEGYFARIGAMGGSKKVPKGFALSGKAAAAGRKGGLISRRTKITSSNVERITQEFSKGISMRELAKKYELSRNTIARIIKTGR
jgi:hypothetical protein